MKNLFLVLALVAFFTASMVRADALDDMLATDAAQGTEPSEMFSAKGDIRVRYLSGEDIIDTYKKISAYESSMKRGEFETKEEFKNRISSIQQLEKDHIFIKIPNYDHFFSYDMDKETYTYRGWSVHNKELSVEIKKIEKALGEYTGRNSFGASANVEKSKESIYGVNFIGINPKNVKQYDYSFAFKLKPSAAKELKKSLDIVVEGVLAKKDKSFTSFDSSYVSPTISAPYEKHVERYFINMRVLKIYVVNKYTDEIISIVPMP